MFLCVFFICCLVNSFLCLFLIATMFIGEIKIHKLDIRADMIV